MFAVIGTFLFVTAQVAGAPRALQDCGKTPVPPHDALIVGGTIATPYSWPWQVEICMFDKAGACTLGCGGSIIDEHWVLSAAHCVDGMQDQPHLFGIRAGIFDYRDANETGETLFRASEVHSHPNYGKPHMISHDLSLLKIDGTFTFTNHIQPVCIAANIDDLVHPGKSAYVTGWGRTAENGPLSFKLRQAHVPFLAQSVCEQEYPNQIDGSEVCAGAPGVDSCEVDSGGPLVTKHKDGRWFQAGIVSWGQGCAEKGHAGVYARPSSMCDFIEKMVGHTVCQ